MEVFCVLSGDCIECGAGLCSIHETQTGALTSAMHLIAEKEAPWVNEADGDNWRYIENTAERNEKVMAYWRIKRGYEIVVVTREQVKTT